MPKLNDSSKIYKLHFLKGGSTPLMEAYKYLCEMGYVKDGDKYLRLGELKLALICGPLCTVKLPYKTNIFVCQEGEGHFEAFDVPESVADLVEKQVEGATRLILAL